MAQDNVFTIGGKDVIMFAHDITAADTAPPPLHACRRHTLCNIATTTTPAPTAAAPARAVVTPKTSVEALWAEYHSLPNASAKHRFWKQHRELHV